MSSMQRKRHIRVYTHENGYILASEAIEHEKLQIKVASDTTLCLNKLSSEEWNIMTQNRTNSVRSPSLGMAFDAYGCLGILSITMQQIQQFQQFQLSTQQMQQQQQFYLQNLAKKSEDATAANMQHFLLFVKEVESINTIRNFEIFRIVDVLVLPLNTEPGANAYNQANANQNQQLSIINEIRKFLSSGLFYFSISYDPNESFDLTLSSQARYLNRKTNKRFLWNFNLHLPLRRLNVDPNIWLLKVICGCVEIKKVITANMAYKACIISRLSCDRVGTRYNCRGVDDDGNCANFVETEQIIFSNEVNEEVSFLQLRGSVPVFFEQSGIQVGSHKIKLSRSTHACQPAFERHMKSLIQDYGEKVFLLNLLGIKGDEPVLTNFFHYLCKLSALAKSQQLSYVNFDYHSEFKQNKQAFGEKLWPYLINEFYNENHKANSTDGMFFSFKPGQVKLQSKFIRTNCMDCLDRTNNMQADIGIEMLPYQLAGFVSPSDVSKFKDPFRRMWLINGDSVSKIYAGTGSIQGKSVTQDLSRSLSRAIQNNFLDNSKQDAIESLLYSMSRNYGALAERVRVLMSPTFLRLPYPILREIVQQKRQYTLPKKCRLAIGTWNINGGFSINDMDKINLNEWLFDGPLNARKTGLGHLDPTVKLNEDIDIFAIGFEEIVDLSAQNIVSASDENATIWHNKIKECLKSQGDYVQVLAENLQLVGVCLFVFVLRKHVGSIRDVCVARTKTGFGGTAGNKGGVLLRFIFYNTSMCFVCSHFAAHQKEIKQRNEDYRQIYEQSEFVGQAVTNNFKIETRNHDYVFWCGDLNYRIDMANDRCRSLIGERDWSTLLELDQLNVQRNEQNVFREFHEAPISFPPTYKYNVHEDTYDRSEKCRVPAWTDRILWRRRATKHEMESRTFNPGKCIYYGRADIRYSDHRPVSALLEVEVDRVIPKRLIEVLNSIFKSSHGSFQVVLVVTTHNNQMNDSIRNEVVTLFQQFRSFVSYRQFKNSLFITYSDSRYGYDAYAHLNNYYLESHDSSLQIRVENEQSYMKLIAHELMDCLASLNSISDNLKKLTMSMPSHDIADVQVNDLLSESFAEENDSSLEVPAASLRPNLSITNNLSNCNLKSLAIDDDDLRHEHHNPIVKALSNSNLSLFDEPHHPKYVHSAACLVDLSPSEDMQKHSRSITSLQPPKRPPPPPASFTNTTAQNKQELVQPLIQIEPLISIESEEKIGFDDDFGKLHITDNFSLPNQTPTNANNFIPPLPPLPSSLPVSSTQSQSKTVFDLFDDSFDPFAPFDNSSSTTNAIRSQTTNNKQSPPPLPVNLPATGPSTQPIIPTRPPPLPPMPTNLPKASQLMNDANFNPFASANFSQPIVPKVPVRPSPPPLPTALPLPPQRPPAFLPNNNNNYNNINNNNIYNQVKKEVSDVDLLGDPGDAPPPPLPPPKMDHFI